MDLLDLAKNKNVDLLDFSQRIFRGFKPEFSKRDLHFDGHVRPSLKDWLIYERYMDRGARQWAALVNGAQRKEESCMMNAPPAMLEMSLKGR
ncbi:hypothetical protein NPIL_25731 [Nephila pilipes]|uniref:Uncharacterized protein n=1 Tax=Nephila pilipes TaxID=299642 RepID=A0A8X6MRW5_NEPPI|nr:hypothetical protein NPIL_25731 [Nephila pilipes]